jgi:hypothetical protein
MSAVLSCSFCRKTEHQVGKLVAGSGVYICDECVAVASRIMRESDSPPPTPLWRRLLSRARRRLGSFRGHFGFVGPRYAA